MATIKAEGVCECGCRSIIKPGFRFVYGHNMRGRKQSADTLAKKAMHWPTIDRNRPTRCCPRCKTEKPRTDFAIHSKNKTGLQTYCKSCETDIREANKAKISARNKRYREGANKTAVRDRNLQYRLKHKDRIREMRRPYFRNYYRNRRVSDLPFKILCTLRSRVRWVIRKGRGVKSARTEELLGCSIPDFILYVESKFEPGMSWENHGKTWDLDHILPCALFDLTKPEHQRRCFHFSNYQPLACEDNSKKSSKLFTQPDHLPLRCYYKTK